LSGVVTIIKRVRKKMISGSLFDYLPLIKHISVAAFFFH